MKRIKLESPEIMYPIGQNLDESYETICEMYEALSLIVKSKETVILWCTGSSGNIVSAIIASGLINTYPEKIIKINTILKNGESRHSAHTLTYLEPSKNIYNVIVDDFISSGETVDKIVNHMRSHKITLDCICVSGNLSTDVENKLKNDWKCKTLISG